MVSLDPVTVLYGLAVLGFVPGVAIVYRMLTSDPDRARRGAFKYLMLIPAVAGVSYVVMFFDVGTVTVGEATIVLPRYIDWLITTPILVGYIGYVAGAPRKWVVGLGLADALMIVFGAVATVTTGPTKWVAFGASALGHASLLGILYAVLPKFLPNDPKRASLFKLLQNHVGLLWLAYPNVWLVGPAGFGLMSGVGLSLIIAYLDVIAKTPYVYFVWNNQAVFDADREKRTDTEEVPAEDGESAGSPAPA